MTGHLGSQVSVLVMSYFTSLQEELGGGGEEKEKGGGGREEEGEKGGGKFTEKENRSFKVL